MPDGAPQPAGKDAAVEAGGPLRLLLEVQDHDISADRLAYRRRELEERRVLSDLDGRLQALEGRVGELRSRSSALGARQSEIEAQVESISGRIAAIETRLRSAPGYREAQAMSEEVDSLARHRNQLEDRELEVMEELEPVGGELGAAEAELASLGGERQLAASRLEEAEALLDAEAATVHAERERLAEGLPAELSSLYERLRERLGGIGAARFVDGMCEGCHLRLPSSERARVLRASPGSMAFCDQCGRILVP